VDNLHGLREICLQAFRFVRGRLEQRLF
jgi:hypothetical protein